MIDGDYYIDGETAYSTVMDLLSRIRRGLYREEMDGGLEDVLERLRKELEHG